LPLYGKLSTTTTSTCREPIGAQDGAERTLILPPNATRYCTLQAAFGSGGCVVAWSRRACGGRFPQVPQRPPGTQMAVCTWLLTMAPTVTGTTTSGSQPRQHRRHGGIATFMWETHGAPRHGRTYDLRLAQSGRAVQMDIMVHAAPAHARAPCHVSRADHRPILSRAYFRTCMRTAAARPLLMLLRSSFPPHTAAGSLPH
jgi:hypothetical protein